MKRPEGAIISGRRRRSGDKPDGRCASAGICAGPIRCAVGRGEDCFRPAGRRGKCARWQAGRRIVARACADSQPEPRILNGGARQSAFGQKFAELRNVLCSGCFRTGIGNLGQALCRGAKEAQKHAEDCPAENAQALDQMTFRLNIAVFQQAPHQADSLSCYQPIPYSPDIEMH